MAVLRFDRCELDLGARQLRVDGGPVHVEPQVFDVLAYLVGERGRAVSKAELLDRVWGSQFVGESALTSRIKSARRAIGDDGNAQRLIQTVHGHGYRFVGSVEDAPARRDTFDHPAAPATPPPSIAAPRRLRPLRTPLIGRDKDLARVAALLDDHPVVTVTGPGGAGKSSLALAVLPLAVRADEQVVFAELAPAADSAELVRAVADAAGLDGPAASAVEPLATALARRPTLLALDNCEHLLDAAAGLVDAVLDRGGGVRVLTTSREPLRVDGEMLHRLGSLGAYAPELFVRRAAAATGGSAVPAADDRELIDLSEQLDGLPLAIELAAAQLGHVTVGDLALRMQQRLDLLVAGRPRAGSRHAALERTIAWSYDLLDRDGREVFVQLGVFPASFDLASAEAVCRSHRPVLAVLGELVAKSLVVHDARTGRYRLLETIRVFASTKSAESGRRDALVQRVCRHVVDRGRALTRARAWSESTLAARSHDDMDTIRFAFDESVRAGRLTDAVDIALGVSPVWRNAASYAEGARWVARLRAADLAPRDRLWTDILTADVALGSGNARGMVASGDAVVRRAEGVGDRPARVIGRLYQGMVLGRPERAIELLGEAAADARALGEPRLEQLARAALLVARVLAGHPVDDAGSLEETVSPDGYDRYFTLWALWVAALSRGDVAELRRTMDVQLDNVRLSGLRENWLTTFSQVLTLIAEGGRWLDLLQEARRRARREGRDSDTDYVLALAFEASCRGADETAAELLGASATRLLRDTANYVSHRVVRDLLVRPRLDPAAFDAATERGRGLDVTELLRAHGLAEV